MAAAHGSISPVGGDGRSRQRQRGRGRWPAVAVAAASCTAAANGADGRRRSAAVRAVGASGHRRWRVSGAAAVSRRG